MTPVAEFVARIKALKAAPASEIVVAAIAGPVDAVRGAVEVAHRRRHLLRRAPARGRWSRIPAPRPTAASPIPGVRIAQAVSAFGANGIAVVDLRRQLRAGAAAGREPDRRGADGGRRHRRGAPGRSPPARRRVRGSRRWRGVRHRRHDRRDRRGWRRPPGGRGRRGADASVDGHGPSGGRRLSGGCGAGTNRRGRRLRARWLCWRAGAGDRDGGQSEESQTGLSYCPCAYVHGWGRLWCCCWFCRWQRARPMIPTASRPKPAR